MKIEEIKKAMNEAQRFIDSAECFLKEQSKKYKIGEHTFYYSAPKESGALRRASMDLTRQLAIMRKP